MLNRNLILTDNFRQARQIWTSPQRFTKDACQEPASPWFCLKSGTALFERHLLLTLLFTSVALCNAGIKPVACSKSLCSHQFDEMGYGASMDTIYHSPHVADLLISMAAAAAANDNLQHRQRFFACPNPPSDFVDDHARALVIESNDTMGINWAELQPVGFMQTERVHARRC